MSDLACCILVAHIGGHSISYVSNFIWDFIIFPYCINACFFTYAMNTTLMCPLFTAAKNIVHCPRLCWSLCERDESKNVYEFS